MLNNQTLSSFSISHGENIKVYIAVDKKRYQNKIKYNIFAKHVVGYN